MNNAFGAESRRVEHRDHLGKAALVGVAVRVYDTTVDDLWDAITTPERLARWFLPVEGDLKQGAVSTQGQPKRNHYTVRTSRNARADLGVRWWDEWVHVRLTSEGPTARLTLEHIAHKDAIGKEHLEKYGPGATGIGWDLSLQALVQYLSPPHEAIDPAAFEAWTLSSEGKTFIRRCGEAWADADIASGASPEEARAQADRTIAFYTGS